MLTTTLYEEENGMKKITRIALLMVTMVFLFTNISYATAITSTEGFEGMPTKYTLTGNFSEGLAPVLDKITKKWGYIDKTGEMVIAPKYSRADEFSGGLARIAICDNWDIMGVYGIIDKTGEIIVPAKYDNIYHFSGNLFQIYTGGKWGIIDKTGEVVVEPKYDDMNFLKNGLSKVGISNKDREKMGYINNAGNQIIAPKYTGLGDFFGGLALAEISGKWGYINQMDEQIVPLKYYNPNPNYYKDNFSEGLVAVGIGKAFDVKYGFADITGKEVITPKYTGVHSFSEELAAVEIGDGADRKWGFIDKTGKEVIPLKYKGTGNFYEGLAPVKLKNKKWALIDNTGKELATLNYDDVHNFSDGYALVYLNGEYGLIDKTGKEIAPPKYDNIGGFSEGLAVVRIGFSFGYIDKTGKEVIPLKYSKAREFSHGVAIIETGYQKCGLIDKTGKEIVPPKYASIGDIYGHINFSEGMVRVSDKNGNYGFINIVNETSTPVTADNTPIKVSNVVRLAGADRYQTAIAISKSGWTKSDNVILVDGNNYPDALVGSSYAYSKDAPILTTPADKLNSDISAEIARLGAKTVYILGNTTSVSQSVADELSQRYNVVRIGGADIFDTAVKVGEEIRKTKTFDTVALATQGGFADALAIAPFSARNNMPLLFSGKDNLRDDTLQALKEWNIKNVVIAGGTGVVSTTVEDTLKNMGIIVTRLAGQDRYDTALEIVKHFAPAGGYTNISVCTGENYPDALTGAVLAAKNNTPLVLVRKDSVKDTISQYINKNTLDKSYIFGGAGVVSDKIVGN